MLAARVRTPVLLALRSSARFASSEAVGLSKLEADVAPQSTTSSWKGIERFYDSVTVRKAQPGARTDLDEAIAFAFGASQPATPSGDADLGWEVVIDGRALRTIGLRPLRLPTESLALAIAAEFGLQRGKIITASTPLYNMASAALDGFDAEEQAEQEHRNAIKGRADETLVRVAEAALSKSNDATQPPETGDWLWPLSEAVEAVKRDGMEAPLGAISAVCATDSRLRAPMLAGGLSSSYESEVMKLRETVKDYLETDTACFRVVARGAAADLTLRRRQDRAYRPFQAFFEHTYGLELAVVEGFADAAHPVEAYVVLEDLVHNADPFLRAALQSLIGATKSTSITLALLYQHVSLQQALEAARVEEEFQIEENGFVEDGHDTQIVQTKVKAAAAVALLRLAPASSPTGPSSTLVQLPGMPSANNAANVAPMVARTRRRRVFEAVDVEVKQEQAAKELQEVIQARGWENLSEAALEKELLNLRLQQMSSPAE